MPVRQELDIPDFVRCGQLDVAILQEPDML
jgi:hypothetical protein